LSYFKDSYNRYVFLATIKDGEKYILVIVGISIQNLLQIKF